MFNDAVGVFRVIRLFSHICQTQMFPVLIMFNLSHCTWSSLKLLLSYEYNNYIWQSLFMTYPFTSRAILSSLWLFLYVSLFTRLRLSIWPPQVLIAPLCCHYSGGKILSIFCYQTKPLNLQRISFSEYLQWGCWRISEIMLDRTCLLSLDENL